MPAKYIRRQIGALTSTKAPARRDGQALARRFQRYSGDNSLQDKTITKAMISRLRKRSDRLKDQPSFVPVLHFVFVPS